VEDLGFVTFDVPDWQLISGLGKGKFSSVFSCKRISSPQNHDFVMKVFRGDTMSMSMAETERDVLLSLREGGTVSLKTFLYSENCMFSIISMR
jgi:hypothetical protein